MIKCITFFFIIVLSSTSVQLSSQDVIFNAVHADNPICDNGYIETIVNSPMKPFSFEWTFDNGSGPSYISSEQNIYQLRSHYTYCVTITDALCRQIKECFVIECEYNPCDDCEIYGEIRNTSCNQKGRIEIEIECDGVGHGPLDYQWSDGPTWKNRSGLAPGTYCLTVTDAFDCEFVKCFEIQGSDVLRVEVVDVENPDLCITDLMELYCLGEIDIEVVSGTPPYTYNWSNGESTQDISDLCEGHYSVTVTDGAGCEVIVNQLICCCEYARLFGGITDGCDGETPISISGQAFSGANPPYISTYASGGNGDLHCSWSGPNGFKSYDCWGVNGPLEIGQYCLKVDDGCEEVSQCFTITDCNENPIAITGNETHTCLGVAFGSIQVNVTGGTSPYDFKWSNGSTSESLDLLPVGEYTVTVTDISGCTNSSAFTINNEVAFIEEYSGDCIFNFRCNGRVVPQKQREGTIEEEFDEDGCLKTRKCIDNFLPSGSEDIGDKELETYIERLNTTNNGCFDFGFYCVGEDEVRGTNDDIMLYTIIPNTRRAEIENTDESNPKCASCYSATVCLYFEHPELDYATNVVDEFVTFDPEPGFSLCPDDNFPCQVSFGCAFVTNNNGAIIPVWNKCVEPEFCDNKSASDINMEDHFDLCGTPTDRAFIDAAFFNGEIVSQTRQEEDNKTEVKNIPPKVEPTILIYPNPTVSRFNAKLLNTQEFVIEKCVIFGINGHQIEVNANQIDHNEIMIDLSGSKSGIYIGYFYTSSGKVFTRKIIKI